MKIVGIKHSKTRTIIIKILGDTSIINKIETHSETKHMVKT